MRVAFFVNDFPALTQTFVLRQIAGLMEAGHDTTIIARRKICATDPHELVRSFSMLSKTRFLGRLPASFRKRVTIVARIAGMKIPAARYKIVFRAINPFTFGKEAASLRLLHQCQPFLLDGAFDILHCQFGMLGPMVMKLRQIGAVSGKLITSFRGFDTKNYLNKHPDAYEELFEKGDLFLPVTRHFKKWLVDNGCPAEKIHTLHSGIDVGSIEYNPRMNRNSQTVRLLSVCRLVEKKGMAYALASVNRVINAGFKVEYTIIGDGPLRPVLEKQIAQLGIADSIRLPGSLPHQEVIAAMQQSHIFLAPSVTAENGDMEGIPNVLKEAMASGMPVLATRHSGIPDLVQDRVSGCLVPERDAEALANSLIHLITHPEEWAKMGIQGRARIQAEFNIDDLNRKLIDLYSNLIEASSTI